MKLLKILFLFFLVFSYSCQKEKVIDVNYDENNHENYSLERNVSDCEYEKQLDKAICNKSNRLIRIADTPPEEVDWMFTIPSPNGREVIFESQYLFEQMSENNIMPTNVFWIKTSRSEETFYKPFIDNGKISYLVMSPIDEYILSPMPNSIKFLPTLDEGILSNTLKGLSERLMDTSIDLFDSTTNVNNGVYLFNNNENVNDNPDVYTKLNLCEYSSTKMFEAYLNAWDLDEFSVDLTIWGSQEVFEATVKDVLYITFLDNNWIDAEGCIGCGNHLEVTNAFLSNWGILNEGLEPLEDIVKNGYIKTKFNFPDDFPIDEYPTELVDKLYELDCEENTWDDEDDWSELGDLPCPPVFGTQHPILENGIDVMSSEGSEDCDGFGVSAANSPNRHGENPEDLSFGTDHNTDGVWNSDGVFMGLTISDNEYFNSMTDLLNSFSDCDQEIKPAINAFLDFFRNNTSNENYFSHPILNQKIAESTDFTIYLQQVGSEISEQISEHGCNIELFDEIDMEEIRPQFNGSYNRWRGLQILVNDTEQTDVYFDESSLECTDDGWCVDVCTEIIDNFGLDKADVLKYQPQMNWSEIKRGNIGHFGFNAWWMLQHQRNYVPFKTKINVKSTICGSF